MTEYKELAARLREIRAQLIRMVDGTTFVRDGHVRVTDPAYLVDSLEGSASAIEAQQARIEALEAERDEARFLLDEGGSAYRAISDLEVQLDRERALNGELRQFSIDYATERDRATAAEARCKRLEEALRPFIPDYGTAEDEMTDAAIASVNITLGDVRRARLALQENTNGG